MSQDLYTLRYEMLSLNNPDFKYYQYTNIRPGLKLTLIFCFEKTHQYNAILALFNVWYIGYQK